MLNIKKIFVALGAVVLFFVYAWFPLSTGDLWNAPDEMAVAYFAQNMPLRFAEYDIPASYTQELGGIVHPRSIVVVNGQLVPSMWLGLPWILSIVFKLTGSSVAMLGLVTPLFATLAVFAWYAIVRRYLSDYKVALFSAVALAIHPGWWYFTARGLHPNVMFTSLLIFSIYFWYVASSHKIKVKFDSWRELMMLLGGLSFGFALFVRTNSAIWLIPILILIAWRYRNLPFRELSAGAIGVLVPIVVMLQLNASIYGGALLNGYSVNVDPAVAEVMAESTVESGSQLLNYIFPFGIHEMNIFRNVWNFHFAFFALWTFFALYGALLVIFRWRSFPKENLKEFGTVIFVAVAVSAYLLVLYGSWNFNDNPDPLAITIGTSYIRYWLPITVAMTPLIGYAIATGFARGRTEGRRMVFMAIWIGALVVTGINLTFLGRDEGLLFIKENISQFENERAFILERTGEHDLVIVDRADKILFPHRQVVVSLRDETTYASLPLMFDAVSNNNASLFYYGITLPENDLQFLHETRLAPFGMTMMVVERIADKSLYVFLKE